MKVIEYEVGVGSSTAYGEVHVSDAATDDEICLAIANRLYSIDYSKTIRDGRMEIEYTVDVGGGCGTGTVLVSENASEDKILLAIMNDLYHVYYH